MYEKYDCIVVGAGPSGTAASYVMAKAGLKVMLIERGDYPGAKNMMGSVIYSKMLEEIIPDFSKDAPLEREIVEQRLWLTSKDSFFSVGYKDSSFNHNCSSILRAKFDRWFAGKAEEVGAVLLTKKKVEDLIWEKKKVVGVIAGRGEENKVFADIVILADGVNSILAQKTGLHQEILPENVAIGVKEIIELSPELIDARFNVNKKQGVAIYLLGEISKGMQGMGFIYTNKDSISLGLGVNLKDYIRSKLKPYELIDQMKEHPCIKPLILGGEVKEYSAHFIPEGGYKAIPKFHTDGLLVVGDAAGLVNSYFREGSNHAMTSGRLAAQTVIKAKEKNDFSAKSLSIYEKLLKESFVIKDLKMLKSIPKYIERNPKFFSVYPEVINSCAHDFLTVDGIPKREKFKSIKKKVIKKISIWEMGKNLFKLWWTIK